MTDEILKRGQELSEEIRELKNDLDTLKHHQGLVDDGKFTVFSLYSVYVPRETTKKVALLLEIELTTILKLKQEEYDKLGKE